MEKGAQEDVVMEKLHEVVEPDPFRSGYAVPRRERAFERPDGRPIAEGANKDECRDQKGPRL